VALAACAPNAPSVTNNNSAQVPSSVSTDVAAAGNVTLKVLDYEAGDGTRDLQLQAINALFQQQYPNVTIDRQTTDFGTMQDTAKLSLSSSDAPCVVEGGQGFSIDAPLVAAHLIIPMDKYAEAYGWTTEFPSKLLDQYRVADDGKTFGTGSIYGISPDGEIVGWFYNKKLLSQLGADVPTTLDAFQSLLAQAKAAGIQPILLGNSEKYPGGHMLSSLASALIGPDTIDKLVYLDPSITWATSGIDQAYNVMSNWVSKGYIQAGYDGLASEDAYAQFEAGKSLFINGGTWQTAEVQKALGSDAGFFVTPGTQPGNTSATGAFGGPFHVTTACAYPDVAAAYINFLITPQAQQEFINQNDIPANLPNATYPANTAAQDTLQAFQRATKDGTLTPYLDWTTTNTGNVLWAGIQEVLAAKTTVPNALKQLDDERDAHVPSN